jgi:hypothetical protein
MKFRSKSHVQGRIKFRSLIEVIRHQGLFKPLSPDDAKCVFLQTQFPDEQTSPAHLSRDQVIEKIRVLSNPNLTDPT